MRGIIGRSRRGRTARRREAVRVEAVGPGVVREGVRRDAAVFDMDHKIAALRIPDDTRVSCSRT